MVKIDILKHKQHKFLFIDGDLWMWDTPRERVLQEKISYDAFGNVLVAGYGFGILQNYLLKNEKVNSITTVEKYKEVIEINTKNKIIGEIIIKDFYKFNTSERYNTIIGDIWQDIDPLFLKNYTRFKKKAKNLITNNGKILAWGGDFFEYLIEINKNKIKS